jgi:hypothetical protein
MFMPLKKQDEFGFDAGIVLAGVGRQPSTGMWPSNPRRDSNKCENNKIGKTVR